MFFFFNLTRFQLRVGRVLDRPTRPGRILKQCVEGTRHVKGMSLMHGFACQKVENKEQIVHNVYCLECLIDLFSTFIRT